MTSIEKVNTILSKIDQMKNKIRQTVENPFLPEKLKLTKIRQMEAALKDAQAFAAVFMGEVLEESQKEVA